MSTCFLEQFPSHFVAHRFCSKGHLKTVAVSLVVFFLYFNTNTFLFSRNCICECTVFVPNIFFFPLLNSNLLSWWIRKILILSFNQRSNFRRRLMHGNKKHSHWMINDTKKSFSPTNAKTKRVRLREPVSPYSYGC